jgi:peptide subunit release factor 1 (eRF1)
MQVNDITPERLRRLAEARPPGGQVLSVFVNLDPAQFATPPARDTQVRSVLDAASRQLRERHDLPHEAREALKEDLYRVEDALLNGLDAKGAHALAVYASKPAGLFEVFKIAEPVQHEPVVADTAYLEPIARLATAERWCVLLANRRVARLFCGNAHALEELALIEDDVHGQHKQGGWSQANYERSVAKDVQDHLRHTAEVAFERLRDDLPAGLLVGGPEELLGDLKDKLHPYLRARLVGRVTVDVENANAEDVRAAAAEPIAAAARRRDDEALARLAEEFSRGGRAAGGLPGVLEALTEQRVETLLVDQGFSAPGVVCPRCGWLGAEGSACPADGTATLSCEDVVEEAVERALTTSASVRMLRDRPELASHGHIAALLRF